MSSPNTALPTANLDQNGLFSHWSTSKPAHKQQSPLVMESEDLGAGRICFIRGNRMGSANPAFKVRLAGTPLLGVSSGLTTNQTRWAIPRSVGNGIERQEQLCSFEYLERYFEVVLRRRTIATGEAIGLVPATTPVTKRGGLLYKYYNMENPGGPTIDGGLLAFADGSAGCIGNMPDIALNTSPVRGVTAAPDWKTKDPDDPGSLLQGVYCNDIHPFLRGKAFGPSKLVQVTKTYGDPARISRFAGDEAAFSALYAQMQDIGLFDWLPDGVVLSKDHVGPDAAADNSFDARLGQLFNVAVQGPATCTSFAGDFKLKCMPGDKVFVLIVADVHHGIADVDAVNAADSDFGNYIGNETPTPDHEKKYFARRKTLMPNKFDDTETWTAFKAQAHAAYEKADNTLTNFRIRLSTSSEMIHTSGVNIAGLEATGDSPAGYKIGDNERMGLKVGATMGEYIVGGFCIGTVLDSAASRAALPGQFSVKSDTSTYALSVYVRTEWWSGDKLFRHYCNVAKYLESRYDKHKDASTDDMYKAAIDKDGVPIASIISTKT